MEDNFGKMLTEQEQNNPDFIKEMSRGREEILDAENIWIEYEAFREMEKLIDYHIFYARYEEEMAHHEIRLSNENGRIHKDNASGKESRKKRILLKKIQAQETERILQEIEVIETNTKKFDLVSLKNIQTHIRDSVEKIERLNEEEDKRNDAYISLYDMLSQLKGSWKIELMSERQTLRLLRGGWVLTEKYRSQTLDLLLCIEFARAERELELYEAFRKKL